MPGRCHSWIVLEMRVEEHRAVAHQLRQAAVVRISKPGQVVEPELIDGQEHDESQVPPVALPSRFMSWPMDVTPCVTKAAATRKTDNTTRRCLMRSVCNGGRVSDATNRARLPNQSATPS